MNTCEDPRVLGHKFADIALDRVITASEALFAYQILIDAFRREALAELLLNQLIMNRSKAGARRLPENVAGGNRRTLIRGALTIRLLAVTTGKAV